VVVVGVAVGKTAAAPRQHSMGSSTIHEHPIAAVVAAVEEDPF
jgi:hypothetical protein